MGRIGAGSAVVVLLVWLLPTTAFAMLHPQQGRFMQRDPLGYVDGMSVYACLRSNPYRLLDPHGTAGGTTVPSTAPCCWCTDHPSDCRVNIQHRGWATAFKRASGYARASFDFDSTVKSKTGKDVTGCHLRQIAVMTYSYRQGFPLTPHDPGWYRFPAPAGFHSFVIGSTIVDYSPDEYANAGPAFFDVPGIDDWTGALEAYSFTGIDYIREAPSVLSTVFFLARFRTDHSTYAMFINGGTVAAGGEAQ